MLGKISVKLGLISRISSEIESIISILLCRNIFLVSITDIVSMNVVSTNHDLLCNFVITNQRFLFNTNYSPLSRAIGS